MAKHSTRQAVHGPVSLLPQMAHLCEGDSEVDVGAKAIPRGAHVFVQPDERFLVDGRIALHESELNEFMLTGEVRPVT